MGIVAKQSIKNLITTYLGFAIGALNTLYLYINFMSETYYGLVGFIISTGMLVMPFMAFGVPNTIVKFYSSYVGKERVQFLTWALFLPFLVAIPLALTCYFFYTEIVAFLSKENAIVGDYVWHIFLIAFSTAYFELFYAWSKVHLKSVFGNFMKEVFHRLLIMTLLILLALNIITVPFFIHSLVGVYMLRMVIMKGYAYYLQRPLIVLSRNPARDMHDQRKNVVLKRPQNAKDVLKYTTLIILAGSVATMLLDLDKFMLGLFQDIDTVAYYGVAIYIATVIAVPLRAMHQITYPMVATMLNQNKNEEMKELYQKSSISLLVISGLLFLLISCNIQSLYELLNPKYAVGLYVVLLIGVANVIAIFLNIILIPRYGIYGAAIATFIASLSYGVIKLMIVKQKFGMQPFTRNTAKAVLLILLFFVGFYFWNLDIQPLLGIVIKSIVMTPIYLFLIYTLNLSVDITRAINTVLKRGV